MKQTNFEFLIPPTFFERAKSVKLTTRETEVMEQLACGESYKTAADALGISPNTLDNHVQSIHKKLGFQSSIQAILFLLQKSPRV